MVHISQIRALPRGTRQFAGLLTRHEPDLLMAGDKVGEMVGAIGSGTLALIAHAGHMVSDFGAIAASPARSPSRQGPRTF
jgi:hypothetical protein